MTKILCIDDEMDFLDNMTEFLASEGFDVVRAENGEEGLQKIAASNPDLVISDIRMPRMDGFDLLKAVQDNQPKHRDLPFMFLSALTQKEDILKGTRLGAEDYLLKPVDFDILLERVKARLHLKDQRQHRHEIRQKHENALMLDLMIQHIRTPLQQLTGYADQLGNHLPSNKISREQRASLEQMHASADELIRMLNMAQNACDLMIGKYPLQLREIPMEEVIKAAVPYATADLGIDPRHIIVDASSFVPPVKADALLVESLMQVLLPEYRQETEDHRLIIRVEPVKQNFLRLSFLPEPLAAATAFQPFNHPLNGHQPNGQDILPDDPRHLLPFLYAQEITEKHGGHMEILHGQHTPALRLYFPIREE